MKTFTSLNGWFSMDIPQDWEEYEDDEEGTYAFFNAEKWTGNLRITPLRNSDPSKQDMATDYLKSNTNNETKRLKLGQLEAVHYKEKIVQDGEEMIIYFWAAGKKNTIFLCSFVINKDMEYTNENENELKLVQSILSSIQIN